ncbi:MAG: sensor histidine kinase [Chloroflexota bacterium]
MRRLFFSLLGGRLQLVLVVAFSLVAALTVGLNALAVSEVIRDYLETTESDLVARDMNLAKAFYQLKLDEVAAISYRLALDTWVKQNLADAIQGKTEALHIIDQQITNKITVLALGGTHLIAVLDAEGNILVSRVLSSQDELSLMFTDGKLSCLPIVQQVLSTGIEYAATEVLSDGCLQQVGLAEQAAISLKETAKAAPQPFDPREGSAGLALAGVYPLRARNGQVMGAVLAAHLVNNDFTLVDRIKEVAGVDTVTIFFGDLRVSTNVPDEQGNRAVGTRVSQDVFDQVLLEGREYVGRAYVVNEWFITRYEPLHDYSGQVVGILYVGALESTFQTLVQAVTNRVGLIALVCIVLAGVIAVPMAGFISRPIAELVEANRRLAQGDMTIRVEPYGSGELALLGHSFNSMVETLQETQQELLHKENLASMGQLAAGVAHELNNPLGTIMLYSDIMAQEASPQDPRRQDLEMIIKETNRCKVIVRDLLNFARQNKVMTQPTNLNALLQKLTAEQRKHPKFEGIEILLELDPALPTIQADELQLQQVFINLMNNAAEAMEVKGGGQLTITTRLAVYGQGVEIAVTDTGTGISEENRAKLFTPFFTTKPVGKGTGLGLAIVYGIIKMHRGQIQVQSQEGAGSTFTITLPLRLPESSESMEGIDAL